MDLSNLFCSKVLNCFASNVDLFQLVLSGTEAGQRMPQLRVLRHDQ